MPIVPLTRPVEVIGPPDLGEHGDVPPGLRTSAVSRADGFAPDLFSGLEEISA